MKNPGTSSEQLRVRGRRTTRLHPWLAVLAAFNFAAMVFAGFLSNVMASAAAAVSVIWWLWLLCLAGSVVFLGWRSWHPFYLCIGPDGIDFSRGRLRAAYKWSEIAEVTVASRRQLFGHRPALYLRPVDGLGPGVVFDRHLSGFSGTLPLRDVATGWIVLCYLNQFTVPSADIDAALSYFAKPRGRVA
jgi:hypothetical protein